MNKKKMLIQIYGDSLSMPRVEPLTKYYETYQELLSDKLRSTLTNVKIFLHTRNHPGSPILSLYNEYIQDLRYFGDDNNNILVIHCGIVDCAPRPVPLILRALISRSPEKIREKIIKIIHTRRAWLLSRGFSWRVTEAAKFKKIYKEWISLAVKHSLLVVVVNIAPTTTKMEIHSPGLTASIKQYNQIIYDEIKVVNSPNLFLFDAYSEIWARSEELANFIHPVDGHHLTRDGHQLYADRLEKIIIKDIPALLDSMSD